jgi:hypothetical protein
MKLEILIPVRNVTDVFARTVASLVAQTDQNFSVLISDNFSTSGQAQLTAALQKLSAAGIVAKKISPPTELGRVEHWNWLHHEADGDWLKPLFTGDWLDANYVATLREVAAANAACRYVFSNGYCHRSGQAPTTAVNPWAGKFNPPAVMQDVVLRYAMQFGPPSAAAYERTAFLALGGYPVALPICADSLFFCTLAARFGAAGIAEPLCHFNIHAARFSASLPGRARDALREAFTYFFLLAYHAWTERDEFPKAGFARLLARTVKHHLK